jgi:hypothetical protein
MEREILLKAYVVHQSDEAFRELVAVSLDEVYSTALRIVRGVSPLAEETALRVFWELARRAPKLGKNVDLGSWLRETTCKTAAVILREDDRVVDKGALKQEMQASSASSAVQPAPRGLALRVCQGVLLNAARQKQHPVFSLPTMPTPPAWIRPVHLRIAAICFLVVLILWNIPFHRRNRIIRSPNVQLTVSSFAQLGSPDEEGAPPSLGSTAGSNTEIHPNQQ